MPGSKPGPSGAVDPLEALDLLYRRHAKWLGAVIRSRFRHLASDADDLVQETYLRIARYDSVEAGRNPKALLHRIAVNLARDHMRRNVVRGGLAVQLGVDEHSHRDRALSVAPEQEATIRLKQLVLALPATYRDVFVLSRFSGMNNADIARHFAISIKTVEWRLSRALALCAEHMRD